MKGRGGGGARGEGMRGGREEEREGVGRRFFGQNTNVEKGAKQTLAAWCKLPCSSGLSPRR